MPDKMRDVRNMDREFISALSDFFEAYGIVKIFCRVGVDGED